MQLTDPVKTTVATAMRTASSVAGRVDAADVLRGLVMILMALDHVRVYSGVPAGGPTPGVFFTRWVTHFCAPVFVFLAGTSAFLYGQKTGDRRKLSRYLLTRGLMLVLMEMTIIRVSWTFSVASLMTFQLAGVIWMLGWCMVIMSVLVRLPVQGIAAFGIIVMASQDALRALATIVPPPLQWLLQFVYFGGEVGSIVILYSIVPWIGVMAAGYAFGATTLRRSKERNRLWLRIGLSATAAFLLIGGTGVMLGCTSDGRATVYQLLDQRKYPASQLFLLMTLGPAIALMPALDHARAPVVRVLAIFGRVPMFYYLLHIPLIHALALGVWLLRDGTTHQAWFVTAPYVAPPEQPWTLPLLYLVFAIAVTILYFPCQWYAGFKAKRGQRWLSYL